MSDERGDLLDQLAKLIADGSEIEWPESSSAQEPGMDRQTLDDLKALARLAEFHQGTSQQLIAELSLEVEQWGLLRVVEKVGEGSFGEVFLAVDSKLDREVALKLLRLERDDAQGRKRALREGRLLAKINHPNVAQVYGADEHGGRVGVWMEFVRGLTLDQMVQLQGALSAREAGAMGVEICRGLAAVHGKGLVHCDIKAQNIMRRSGGRILLVDFGLGAEAGRVSADAHRVRGTPLYLAPETLSGSPATRRSDIYALGVLLYFLVTETFPVIATGLDELRQQHQSSGARLLSDARSSLPSWFIDVVQTALSPHPEERFATVGEMERALATGMAPLVLKPDPVPKSTRRRAGWAAMILLPFLLVAALWWIGYFSSPPPTDSLPKKSAGVVFASAVNQTQEPELDLLGELLEHRLSVRDLPLFEVANEADIDSVREIAELGNQERLDAAASLRAARAMYRFPVVIESTALDFGSVFLIKIRVKNPLPLLRGGIPLKNEWYQDFRVQANSVMDDLDGIADWIEKDALEPILQRIRYHLALSAKQEKQPDEALGNLKLVIEEDPGFVLAYTQMASILLGRQRWGEGYRYLKEAQRLLDENPDQGAEAMFARTMLYDSTEDYSKNELYCRELLEIAGEHPRWLFRLALAQIANWKFRGAIETFAAMPHIPEANMQQARVQLALGEFGAAEALIQGLKANEPWRLALRGSAAFLQEDYQTADDAFQRMRNTADSVDANRAFSEQAYFEGERGRYDKALQHLQGGIRHALIGIELNEEDPNTLEGDLNQKRLARAAMNSLALAHQPDNQPELIESIRADCSAATARDDPVLIARAGIISARSGLLADAQEYQQRLEMQYIDFPIYRRWRLKLSGEVLLAQGRSKEGLHRLEEAALDDPAFYPRDYLARGMVQAGQLERAAEEYEKIIAQPGIFWILPVHERWPGLYAATLMDWVRLALQMGRTEEARQALERYQKLRSVAQGPFSKELEEARQVLRSLR